MEGKREGGVCQEEGQGVRQPLESDLLSRDDSGQSGESDGGGLSARRGPASGTLKALPSLLGWAHEISTVCIDLWIVHSLFPSREGKW